MTIKFRPYKGWEEFDAVGNFLFNTYKSGGKYPNWLQARWEYMHAHPNTDESTFDKIGIWEDDGKIVALATHEGNLGEVYFSIDPNYPHLKKSMFEYAENNLCEKLENGKVKLAAHINNFDNELEEIAKSKGFVRDEGYPEYKTISQFIINDNFPEITLPEGYKLVSLNDEPDIRKFHRIMWRGFNHEGEAPEEGIEWRVKMQSAPNYNRDLNIAVVAPDGNFVAFSGIWFDPINKLGYVEPVCTDPEYRKLGLGKAAVLECIRRIKDMGAKIAFVESGQQFYLSIGFVPQFMRYPWVKEYELSKE